MRSLSLAFLPILLSLGCATQERSLEASPLESAPKSCLSHRHSVKDPAQPTQPCKTQRAWLERLGTALDGAATALRAPIQ
jgi:hypothetical protein